jgi:hypothetical protein
MAALDAGAVHVTGIEGRQELVDNANSTFAGEGIDSSRFTFIRGDVHDQLTAGLGSFDVVMCLGFLYHTLRYPELFTGIRATGAKYVIVDTKVFPGKRHIVRLINNPNALQSMAVEDRFSYRGNSLVGTPTASAVVHMLDAYGYDVVARADWGQLLAAHPDIATKKTKRYASGERVTMLAVSRD